MDQEEELSRVPKHLPKAVWRAGNAFTNFRRNGVL